MVVVPLWTVCSVPLLVIGDPYVLPSAKFSFNVPNDPTVIEDEMDPVVPSPTCIVPSLIAVAPVYVFAPVSNVVPGPILVTARASPLLTIFDEMRRSTPSGVLPDATLKVSGAVIPRVGALIVAVVEEASVSTMAKEPLPL